jgi:hypothetical protein
MKYSPSLDIMKIQVKNTEILSNQNGYHQENKVLMAGGGGGREGTLIYCGN